MARLLIERGFENVVILKSCPCEGLLCCPAALWVPAGSKGELLLQMS